MICLDTTFLVHLWRHRSDMDHPVHRVLREHPAEVFAVPVTAAGEFLEGAAFISEERLDDGVRFLNMFLVGDATLDTGRQYARLTAKLRRAEQLVGVSQADLWIAAWALQHNAMLATNNVKHFGRVPELKLVPY